MEIQFRATVLVVDEPEQLPLMNSLLQEQYVVKLADNARDAMQIAQALPHPDLILVGAQMRDRAGISVVRQLKADLATFDIAVIAMTDPQDPEQARRALREGAADHIARPVEPQTLAARLAAHIALGVARTLLAKQDQHLQHLVDERTRELSQMHDATILAMASLAETRDSDTCNHLRRTQHVVAALARALQNHPRFCGELSDDNIGLLYRAAPLHDIGKVGVPDAILLKPGRLSNEEYEIMKCHTVYGRDAILDVEKHLGGTNNFLRYAREIAYSHQEKWDGSGYPEGLAGDAIPLAARLMAVADVYDAMISKRIYKPAFTHETALELIRQGRDEHFDPDVVDAMIMIEEEIMAISATYADPE